MLERQWSAGAGPSHLHGPGRDSEFVGFADIVSFIRQRLFLIMAFPLLGVLGAGFYLATTDPTFTAQTQILIEPKIPELLQQQSGEISLSLDTSQVERPAPPHRAIPAPSTCSTHASRQRQPSASRSRA